MSTMPEDLDGNIDSVLGHKMVPLQYTRQRICQARDMASPMESQKPSKLELGDRPGAKAESVHRFSHDIMPARKHGI